MLVDGEDNDNDGKFDVGDIEKRSYLIGEKLGMILWGLSV